MYAALLTNETNRFVTKIEDDFSFSSAPFSFLPPDFFSFLSDVYNGGGTSAVRCCDDATGTYMVIM